MLVGQDFRFYKTKTNQARFVQLDRFSVKPCPLLIGDERHRECLKWVVGAQAMMR